MARRKKIVAGNWKMNKTSGEAKALVHDLLLSLKKTKEVDVVICPPFTSLAVVSEALHSSHSIYLGAQNLYPKASGAYTGEISAPMLRDLYCRYVILGHSERRQHFCENNAFIHQKMKAAIGTGLRPILCIGETLEERDGNRWEQVLTTQLHETLHGFDAKEAAEILVAYEPIWAIGTGKAATSAQAQQAHHLIRAQIAKIFSLEIAEKMRLLYGGSTNAANSKELFHQPDIDGALVGGASLDAGTFVAIVKNACVA